jgi:glycosyltransferase involved in cell wall biosynthesis
VSEYLPKALSSVANQTTGAVSEILLVGPSDVTTHPEVVAITAVYSTLRCVESTQTDYASQVNLGIQSATGEWVAVLEFDDELSITYVANLLRYQQAYPDTNAFLPLVIQVNPEEKFIDFANQMPCSSGFDAENQQRALGVVTEAGLEQFPWLLVSGTAFRKTSFLAIGGLKSRFPVAAEYEFFRRWLANDNGSLRVIPKLGYQHLIGRPDSNFDIQRRTITPEEFQFWMEAAVREYHFKEDREILR